jgi:hypothetical protein
MESTQLEVGSYEPNLFLDYTVAGSRLINNSWMTAILERLSLCKGTITTTHPWLCHPDVDFMNLWISQINKSNASTPIYFSSK